MSENFGGAMNITESSCSIKPLVVDLDGTLIKTDMFLEGYGRAFAQSIYKFLFLLFSLTCGRSEAKARLAKYVKIAPEALPYNENVLCWLKTQRANNREIVLATATGATYAKEIASYLGIFDSILTSSRKFNLKGKNKAEVLRRLYGENGFDYLGDSAADLEVWKIADKAYVVSSSKKFVERVKKIAWVERVFTRGKPWIPMVKVLRPHQWVKNLLIFVPLLASRSFGEWDRVIEAVMAFVSFCLVASSVYIVNDLVDVDNDRYHETKRKRPFAAGDLSLLYGWLLWPVLAASGCALALVFLGKSYFILTLSYFLLTMLYSMYLKRIELLDVLVLACLYTLRIFGGGVAINVPLSFWLLTFSVFIFTSLAFAKRYCEIGSARKNEQSGLIKGRGYAPNDLEAVSAMGVAAGYVAVLVLALYLHDENIAAMYRYQQLIWLSCPLLLYWISRVWLVAHRFELNDDPIVFALKDKQSWAVLLSMLCLYIVSAYA